MSTSIETTLELPDTGSTVRKALETERRRLHVWAAGLVKEVEGRRDEALRRLDLSESALTRDTKVVAKPAPIRSKRPGGKRGVSPADEHHEPTAIYEADRKAVTAALLEPGSKARNERGSLGVSQFKAIGPRIWQH